MGRPRQGDRQFHQSKSVAAVNRHHQHQTDTLIPSDPDASLHDTVQARTKRTWPRVAIALAIVILGAASWWYWHARNAVSDAARTAAAAAGAEPALTVTAASVKRVTWPQVVEASGSIAPWQDAIVGARVGGLTLSEVRVNVGDKVERGQVIARFDTALLRADEAQLMAGVAQVEVTLAQADANSRRSNALRESGSISEQEILQADTVAATARGAVASAKATLLSKQLQLQYGDVRAPDDGTISSRSATLGGVAAVGQELFRLIRQDRLEWRGELTPTQLSQIARDQRVVLTLPDGSRASAHVRQTSPALSEKSRLATVFADIEPGSAARSNMYAAARIEVGQTEGWVVPAVSVVIRDGRSYVFTLQGDETSYKVAIRAVTVGRRQGTEVEIAAGLTGVERVVAQGAGFLADGDVVRLSQPVATTPVSTSGAGKGWS